MKRVLYEFEWDPAKARTNITKHRLDFERAATVFLDPLAITISDDEHSGAAPRWITLGKNSAGAYVIVIHTFIPLENDRARIRLISARRPTKAEVRSYEEQQ